jgi:phosphate-selective porin OprO and OprP
MNHFKPKISLFLILFVSAGMRISAQSTNDVLNVLIANGTISQQQADSVRAEAAIKQQEADAAKKSFFVNAARQMQLSGYTQFRYQILDEPGKKDGFDIRRARLDLKGNLTPFFGYRLQADFAEKPKMIDAFGDIKLADYFTITAGQFKIPFSMESVAADNKLEVIDRSQVVEALAARSKDVIGNQNGRDIGIQAGGVLLKTGNGALLEYQVGVFNGSGINVADTANEAKDVAGRIVLNPVKGLSFGVSGYNGWGRAIKPDEKGKSQVRNRFGVEASYTTPRISVKAEYIQGQDGITDKKGGYLQAGYFILPQRLQLVAKYDVYDPSTEKKDNISTLYVAGVNIHFNAWSKLQLFYTFREEEGPSVNNNYFAMQFQIGF